MVRSKRLAKRILPWLTLLSATGAAFAAEVVVKNDSFVDGGSTVIVGDFVAGEEAGARLVAPCNGTIVAVQIAWLEGTAGHGQSLEEAIHIYDGSTFPSPGTELETLVGPVMTPGFINEFRYLDQAQTIPLSVPVTAGQQFTVTLEFFNPTNVGGGGPSVIRDVDGCLPGSNVLFAIPGGWFNFCLLLQGDVVIRAVIDCQEADEACCLTDGSCVLLTPTECGAQGGTAQGPGSNCTTANCPQPSQACCFESTGGCLDLTEADCLAANGIPGGLGTSCATYVCFPVGACCLPNGNCLDDMTPEDCDVAGGVFQGDGTTCATANCPEPMGACCFSSGGCLVFTEANCAIADGTWKGAGTDCSDNDQSGTADACEAACPGDLDGDNDVDLADLSLLLSNYPTPGGASPEDGDLDGDGDVDLADLAALLAAYGVPCP